MYETKYHTGELSKHNFLITGGAGFIGSNIVEYLLKFGAGKVRVLDDFSTGSRNNIAQFVNSPAFELIEGSICNIDVCRAAVKGIDHVSHQAALGSVPRSIADPITTNEVNITGFLNLLVAARDEGIKHLVYAASSSTYGDHPDLPKVEDKIGSPLSPYAITKYVNELYAGVFSLNYKFHSIGLRYFNVFGPKQNPNGAYAAVIPLFIESAINNKSPFIFGDGETSRDFTFIENVVQANIKALLKEELVKHEVVNIAFGERITLNQLWDIIAQISKSDKRPIYNAERDGDVRHSLASIKKAELLLGYSPLFAANKGLKIAFDYYASLNETTKKH